MDFKKEFKTTYELFFAYNDKLSYIWFYIAEDNLEYLKNYELFWYELYNAKSKTELLGQVLTLKNQKIHDELYKKITAGFSKQFKKNPKKILNTVKHDLPYCACYLNQPKELSSLLSIFDLSAKDKHFLHIAASENLPDMADEVLSYPETNVNQEYQHNTPLALAVSKGHLEISEQLLKKGADPNVIFHEEHQSLIEEKPILLRILTEDHDLDISTLLSSIKNRSRNSLPKISSLLHVATSSGFAAIVKLLLQYNANPNAIDYNRQTPLHLAVITGNMTIIGYLAEVSNINLRDHQGNTPLHYAAINGDINIAKFLSEKGAKDDILNHQLMSARQIADNNNNTDIVALSNKDSEKQIAKKKLFGENQAIHFKPAKEKVVKTSVKNADFSCHYPAWTRLN